jgi:hypothetical protein
LRALTQHVEARGHLGELLGAALPVEHELVGRELRIELDVGVRPERFERNRDRADGRDVEPRVGLAPVFDEREIRACSRARAPLGRVRGAGAVADLSGSVLWSLFRRNSRGS